ncbi:MAG TPA: 1-deoxy-D-xylulose-5-phosphate reductoisomerase, partial [Stellaceae bacterium]|nr:1-deoxy-D-xylulose-5-phosphate reductoisomerase [Stellaceae bacterium]
FGARILPVDSEHNAVFQALGSGNWGDVRRVILTASGGPFRTWSLDAINAATPEQALKHPNWSMGPKVTIDSATLMNKGLEVIEAHHLFQLPSEQIGVVVHPHSIIHGLVTYKDGSVLAHMGSPDMRTPISYVLGWPDRTAYPSKGLDLAAIGRLTFEAPDKERFPALRLAREALISGGCAATVLNAANETAVYAFMDGRIGFLDIAATVEETLAALPGGRLDSLDDVYGVDLQAREIAARVVASRGRAHLGRNRTDTK